ncbi:MAG: hypothetical protein FJW32_00845 [Acidobacteria bacterium]|nr:hypothetical protein [Acidobacteriota bacterium]
MVPAPQEPDRLDSWKQIAAYLNKSERTVRRWQELEGLPVHRHLHQQKGTVWAFKSELDGWLANRTEAPVPVPGAPDRSWLLPSLGAIVAIGLVFWIYRPAPQKPLETSVLTALPGMEYGASISPDGSRFAFFWGPEKIANHGIYTKSFGDEPPAPLILRADTDKFFYNPVWSPDGKTIAFLSRNPEQQGFLNVISSTGGPIAFCYKSPIPARLFSPITTSSAGPRTPPPSSRRWPRKPKTASTGSPPRPPNGSGSRRPPIVSTSRPSFPATAAALPI